MVIATALTTKLKQHPVIEAVYRISHEAGVAVYLVGGAVRDLLAAILPEKDFDFVVESDLKEVARLFAKRASGSFIQLSSDPLYYRVILYCTGKRIEVDFSQFQGDDLDQDLHNRDFTVNALALSLHDLFQEESPKPYDPLGGAEDLHKGLLRSASHRSFDNDPLRMLRAVRIAKARSLAIDRRTREEIKRRNDRLLSAAAERIRSELFKTLSFRGADDSLRLLDELGLLATLLPETQELKNQTSKEPRGLSLWDHSLERVHWCEWMLHSWESLCPGFQEKLNHHFHEEIEADVDRESLVKLGAFLLNCARPAPTVKESYVAGAVARRFKLGKRAANIVKAVSGHPAEILKGFLAKKLNPRVYFRFYSDLGPEGLDVLVLSWSDYITSTSKRFGDPLNVELRDLFESLVAYYFDEYCATSPRPLITGKVLMEQFRLAEGKIIGSLLEKVAEAEAEGLLRSSQEAMLYVQDLLRRQQKSG